MQAVLNPCKQFVAIVAGAKYDTKIGPLKQIYKKVDKLVLGGLIYNTYLCAKYGVKIAGVEVCILFPSSLRCVSVELVCCFTYFMYFSFLCRIQILNLQRSW